MNAKERAEHILGLYSPFQTRKKAPMYGLLSRILSPEEPNKKKTTTGRFLDNYDELQRSLRFLAGILTLLPFTNSKRRSQYQDDGEKLLLEAHEFARNALNGRKVSVASVRKMRVFGEKVQKLTAKIKKDLSAGTERTGPLR